MTEQVHPYLRYLAAWDRTEAAFHAELDRLAGRQVRFAGVPKPSTSQEACLAAFTADPMAAVTESTDGTLLLPGNPHKVLRQLVEEQYPVPRARRRFRLPRRIARARLLEDGHPEPRGALRWPDEPRVDRYRRALYIGLVDEARRNPRARAEQLEAPPWPGAKRCVVCMTYEVADEQGLRRVSRIMEEDLSRGTRPAFFVAPQLLRDKKVEAVVEAGCEVGLLGAGMQGLGPRRLSRQLGRLKAQLTRHQLAGFRGCPWSYTPRHREALAGVFEYGCSIPDTAAFRTVTQHRGCAVTVPFGHSGLLEIPITAGPEQRLLQLGYQGLDLLDLERQKAMAVRERFGVIVFANAISKEGRGSRVRRDLLGAILGELHDREDAWFATPAEVSGHWLRAARSLG